MSDDIDAEHQAVQAEGQGLWQNRVYHVDQFPAIAATAEQGDVESMRLQTCIDDFATAAKKQHLCCLVCGKPFGVGRRTAALTVLSGFVDQTNNLLAAGLCGRCHARSDLKSKIVAAWQKQDLPELDRIPAVHNYNTTENAGVGVSEVKVGSYRFVVINMQRRHRLLF